MSLRPIHPSPIHPRRPETNADLFLQQRTGRPSTCLRWSSQRRCWWSTYACTSPRAKPTSAATRLASPRRIISRIVLIRIAVRARVFPYLLPHSLTPCPATDPNLTAFNHPVRRNRLVSVPSPLLLAAIADADICSNLPVRRWLLKPILFISVSTMDRGTHGHHDILKRFYFGNSRCCPASNARCYSHCRPPSLPLPNLHV